MSTDPSSNASCPLTGDIHLADEEIWTHDGRICGFDTTFIASQRKVIHKKWVWSHDSESYNIEQELSIPDHISSEEELRQFIKRHDPLWLK